jgi:hypothetical protein
MDIALDERPGTGDSPNDIPLEARPGTNDSPKAGDTAERL